MVPLQDCYKTIIIQLKLRNPGSDSLSARLRVATLLNTANLQPPGLPSTATLCIRKLCDPLPGRLSLHRDDFRPSPAWEQAVKQAIDQLTHQAARPIDGPVPANAEAVLFNNRAEMLACLASDFCEGSMISRWWWQSLLKGKEISQTVLSAWLEAPEFIPHALERMAKNGKVIPFIHELSRLQAVQMVQAMIHCFGLTELKSCFESLLATNGSVESYYQASEAKIEFFSPPWQQWVPEGRQLLKLREQHYLLGIGLMLQRAPSAVRSIKFAQAVRQWQQASRESKSQQVKTNSPVAVEWEPGISEEKISAAAQTPDIDQADTGKKLSPLPVSTQVNDGQSFTTAPAHVTVSGKNRQPAEDWIEAPDLPEVSLETEYGGIFYLINLGLFLELYRDFTRPLEPGIALPIWDFVALLGQALVGDKITADPVWLLLAQLAGRNEGEIPGQSFEPPDEWRLPVEWLKPFPEPGICLWSVVEDRLWVKHAEQFWLLDLMLKNKSPEKLLRKQMQAYRVIADLKLQPELMTTKENVISGLERWLNWLMPYVRARLKRALRLAEDKDLCFLLCEHQARVQVNATQLDVVLSLAELPIAIRMSGLDRNPGWVPAAGRYISFYFE